MIRRFTNEGRRRSTIKRDSVVLGIYREVKNELGELAGVVSKQYIYDKIKERTGLCTKTISFIVNHVNPDK